MTRPNRLPHWLILILLSALTLILLGLFIQTELQITGGQLGVPLDDAWIHFQFARNLSRGLGFSFNPGEPTPGSTAPLWTLMLAAVGLVTEEFLVSSLVISSLFFLVAIVLTYGFTFYLTQSRFTAFVAALGVTFSGRLLWAGLSGMETMAFTALSLGAVWSYSRKGLAPLPALLFGLASQLRPIGHALFFLALVDTVWLLLARYKSSQGIENLTVMEIARKYGPPLLIYAVISTPYVLFSLSTTGRPLPNTYYAKVDTDQFISLRTLRETALLLWRDNPVAIVLAPFGIVTIWRRCRLVILWLVALPLLAAIVVDFVWHHGRYTMPIIPFLMIVAASGAFWLFEWFETRTQSSYENVLFKNLIAITLVAIFIAAGAAKIPTWARMLGDNTREILEIDVALGEWLQANTPNEATIAVDDIGAIGYLSERKIIDLNGLVSPEMWPAIGEDLGLDRDQVTTQLLSESQPDYLVGFPLWHWEIANNAHIAEPLFHAQTDTHTIIFQQDAFVYEMSWPYLDLAAPEFEINAVLGDSISLVGYDIVPSTSSDEALELTLYWKSLAPVMGDYDVFVHVLDSNGEIVSQIDQQPLNGLAATSVWRSGQIIRVPYKIPLPPDQGDDNFIVKTGMYLRESGARLPVAGDVQNDGAVELTTLQRDGATNQG